MRYILFAFVLTFGILLFSCEDPDAHQSRAANASKASINGAEIYRQNCVTCHGANGKLALNGAAKFTESRLTLEERIAVIANGRKTMLPYKSVLSAAEIEAVALYTMQFNEQ